MLLYIYVYVYVYVCMYMCMCVYVYKCEYQYEYLHSFKVVRMISSHYIPIQFQFQSHLIDFESKTKRIWKKKKGI